jgi:deazaflavin-dependent oxidoreductase (nitroreductase family)
MARRPLPYVDPQAPRGPVQRAWIRLLSTRLTPWFERTFVWRLTGWRLAPRLMRLTGRLSVLRPLPTALLETRDARNGRPHRRAVVYFHDGERVTIIPSKAGLPEDPFWYRNALAEPEVMLGGQPFRAEVVENEAERARLWKLADPFFPPYADYRRHAARAGRTIPILQLVPR